jgi:hypothetical protein
MSPCFGVTDHQEPQGTLRIAVELHCKKVNKHTKVTSTAEKLFFRTDARACMCGVPGARRAGNVAVAQSLDILLHIAMSIDIIDIGFWARAGNYA